MKRPKVIRPDRLRVIKSSFAWVDHRFINEGYIRQCSKDGILLYFFLITVGNREGLSFWGDRSICSVLKLEMDQLIKVRSELIDKSLIAYTSGIYQVLSLPDDQKRRSGGLESIGEILNRLAKQGGGHDARS